MKKQVKDLLRSTLNRMKFDERFTIHGPIEHPKYRDVLNVFFDYVQGSPPYKTYVVEFHKSQMRSLTKSQVVKYVEMTMRSAEGGLLDEIAELEEE